MKFRIRKKPGFIFGYVVLLLLSSSCKEDDVPQRMLVAPTITSFTPTSGVSGTLVTIVGAHFSAALDSNEVFFNGTKATVKSVSFSQLLAEVPTHATSGKISVSVTGHGVVNSSVDFEVFSDIPRDGLIAYYPFNGNANDESGHGLDGVVYGAQLFADRFGNTSKCYSFNGIDDYIFVANSSLLQISPAITITAWVKVSGTPFSVYLLSKIGKNANGDYHGYEFLTFKDAFTDNYSHGLVLSGTTMGLTLTQGDWLPNEWTHLAASLENDHTKLYINGIKILDSSGSRSLSNIDTTLGDLLIGKNAVEGLENPFIGLIDEVAIYNRALSDSEIADFYSATKIH